MLLLWARNNLKFTLFLQMMQCSLTQECQSSTEHEASNVRLVWRQRLPLQTRRNTDRIQRVTHAEAAASHKTLTQFYQTTRCHNPEDGNGHSLRCENLKCVEILTIGRRQYVTWPQAWNKATAVKEGLTNVWTKRRMLRNKHNNCASEYV
jgi:hypothetical protein